ncbi:hypothetical protein [Dactylosporangium sp. CA-139066]|uniref:hypothetical protein n=1 Tax=Dactylosporangium sp. CA-139066 TaxID=3239930 RepID=UPI003D92DA08
MPCDEPFVPRPRSAADDLRPGEVPRADVEHLIARVLHEQSCGDENYAGDPQVAAADRAGHAWDARAICDALAERGWIVHRTDRRDR